MKTILVTGGAGFIGSNFCRHLIELQKFRVINVDKLTYAADQKNLSKISNHPNYRFYHYDICDRPAIRQLLSSEKVDAIVHLAAESHVDRSIGGPADFIQTNIVGTFTLLEAARDYYQNLTGDKQQAFRFHHVSTDEVFGDLPLSGGKFTENSPYKPSSPYSASKAASDHLVRAWSHTYGLPILLSNCSNNYGPRQFPEKLIPLMILTARDGKPLPVYGDGANVRDWLHVDDHAQALALILQQGKVGSSYAVGGNEEHSNLAVVQLICDLLDKKMPRSDGLSRRQQITFVKDRPGHDRRYAIDASHIQTELGWKPQHNFVTGLSETIDWYCETYK